MPYIKPEDRVHFVDMRAAFADALLYVEDSAPAGVLNFAITSLVDEYLASAVRESDDLTAPGYALYNEVVGVLECAKLELYRRLAAPYEDRKIAANGDVYTVGR